MAGGSAKDWPKAIVHDWRLSKGLALTLCSSLGSLGRLGLSGQPKGSCLVICPAGLNSQHQGFLCLHLGASTTVPHHATQAL